MTRPWESIRRFVAASLPLWNAASTPLLRVFTQPYRPLLFGRCVCRPRGIIRDRWDHTNAAVSGDFDIQIVIGSRSARLRLSRAEALHQLLRAFLFSAGKQAITNPFDAARNREFFPKLGYLRFEDSNVVELLLELGLLRDETLKLFFEISFVVLGCCELSLGVGNLNVQVRDGAAELRGLLIQGLILSFEIGDLCIALLEFLFSGLQIGLSFGERVRGF